MEDRHHQAHHDGDKALALLAQSSKQQADALAKIEIHLRASNGHIKDNLVRSTDNQSSLNRVYWILGIGTAVVLAAVGTCITAILNLT